MNSVKVQCMRVRTDIYQANRSVLPLHTIATGHLHQCQLSGAVAHVRGIPWKIPVPLQNNNLFTLVERCRGNIASPFCRKKGNVHFKKVYLSCQWAKSTGKFLWRNKQCEQHQDRILDFLFIAFVIFAANPGLSPGMSWILQIEQKILLTSCPAKKPLNTIILHFVHFVVKNYSFSFSEGLDFPGLQNT